MAAKGGKEGFWPIKKSSENLLEHPSLDTPQKKNQKTHLGDPKIYQVKGMDIQKQEVVKFS